MASVPPYYLPFPPPPVPTTPTAGGPPPLPGLPGHLVPPGTRAGPRRLKALWFNWQTHIFDALWPDFKVKTNLDAAHARVRAEGLGVGLYTWVDALDLTSEAYTE